nr:MAG TPA: hypothetical protein [Caudoviricetes sp.]
MFCPTKTIIVFFILLIKTVGGFDYGFLVRRK